MPNPIGHIELDRTPVAVDRLEKQSEVAWRRLLSSAESADDLRRLGLMLGLLTERSDGLCDRATPFDRPDLVDSRR